MSLGLLDDAAAAFRQFLAHHPNDTAVLCSLGGILKNQGLLDDAIAAYRRALALNPALPEAHSNIIATMLYNPASYPSALPAELRRWNLLYAAPLASDIRPHLNDRSPDRKLRIGFVSPDFRTHVVGKNLLPLFKHFDSESFDFFCYADVPAPDLLTAEFRRRATSFRHTSALSHAALADQIHTDRIDILLDLTLHLAGNRLLVFARKPAPVQVTFAGYPGSTGLQAIDYRLSDPYLDPPDLPDDPSCYSEKTLRLPATFWCYDPFDDAPPPVNSLPALSTGTLTFGCLNNFCKISPANLDLWSRLLNRLPQSRLLLLAEEGSHRARTTRFLQDRGIHPSRVTFFTTRPQKQYLELYHQIDLSLDTLPYNGHTTSLDSLFMGVPVITLVGNAIVGRAGLSQLTNLALPEFIAHSEDQFLAIALDWSANLERLAALRATLRSRMQNSPLMDAPAFTRALQTAFRQIWHQWCNAT
jgi:predicted O-linked N-acetylglucosamine transferase (SPINDLY family)